MNTSNNCQLLSLENRLNLLAQREEQGFNTSRVRVCPTGATMFRMYSLMMKSLQKRTWTWLPEAILTTPFGGFMLWQTGNIRIHNQLGINVYILVISRKNMLSENVMIFYSIKRCRYGRSHHQTQQNYNRYFYVSQKLLKCLRNGTNSM